MQLLAEARVDCESIECGSPHPRLLAIVSQAQKRRVLNRRQAFVAPRHGSKPRASRGGVARQRLQWLRRSRGLAREVRPAPARGRGGQKTGGAGLLDMALRE